MIARSCRVNLANLMPLSPSISAHHCSLVGVHGGQPELGKLYSRKALEEVIKSGELILDGSLLLNVSLKFRS